MLNQRSRNPGLDLLHEASQEDSEVILEILSEGFPVDVLGTLDSTLVLEAKRKDILKQVDPRFINHRKHYDRLFKGTSEYPGGGGVSFDSITVDARDVNLKVKGSWEWVHAEGKPKQDYIQTFNLSHLKSVVKGKKKNWREKALALLNGHMRVHCDCPAFRYFYAYTATKGGFALHPEMRPANIRNPGRSGAVCKHLELAMRFLPAFWSQVASGLKKKYAKP